MIKDFAPAKTLSSVKVVKKPLPKEIAKKTNRRLVILLLTLTIGLSLFSWKKPRLEQWWQKLWEPASYEIINPEVVDTQLLRMTSNLHSPSDVVAGIKELVTPLQGIYGVYVESLDDKTTYGINQEDSFLAASVNKILIMAEFLQEMEKGRISFEDEYRLQAQDIQDYGTGSMRYAQPGTVYTYQDLLELSGKQSDNTATWVLALILGNDHIQQFIDSLGMSKTSLSDNTTTPVEMGHFWARIFYGEILTEDFKEKFYDYLTHTDFEERIPAGVPSLVSVAHKIGTEIQTVNDCGIIFNKKHPYVLCIFSKEAQEGEALKVIPKISHLVWSYESTRP